MLTPWRLLLLVAPAGVASDADRLDPLAMHQMLREMRVQMSELQRAHEQTRERMSNLEAENERLRAARALSAAPSGPEKWAVETTGAGRRLSQSCCRWTNGGTCLSADVTDACTDLHEYMEHKTTTHVFEDVSSCPGSDPSALFHAQTAEVAMSSGGSEVARVPTPLRVTHASDCTGATMRVQLNTTVGGNLDVEGSLTVGGGTNVADRLDRIEAMLPPFPPVVFPNTADEQNPDWQNEVKFMLKNERSGLCIAPNENPPADGNEVLTYTCNTATLKQWWFWEGAMLKNYGGYANNNHFCLYPVGPNAGDQMRVQNCDKTKSEHRWYWNNNGGNNNRQSLINMYSYMGLACGTPEGSRAVQYEPSGYNNADHRWSYFTG